MESMGNNLFFSIIWKSLHKIGMMSSLSIGKNLPVKSPGVMFPLQKKKNLTITLIYLIATGLYKLFVISWVHYG